MLVVNDREDEEDRWSWLIVIALEQLDIFV